MELVDGLPLNVYVKERQLEEKQILELMRAVCQGVQHAHQQGVIHRDLKPSNILVTGEGQPKVLDFNLVKSSDRREWEIFGTPTSYFVGTVPYMAPQQAGTARPTLARTCMRWA